MELEFLFYAAAGLLAGGLMTRWAMKATARHDSSPVSTHWLQEQRGRPDIS